MLPWIRIAVPEAVRSSIVRKLCSSVTALHFAFPDVRAGDIIGDMNGPPGESCTKEPS